MDARHLALCANALLTIATSAGARTPAPVTSKTASAVTRSAEIPPEWAVGCPVPTLEQCQEPGYLEGALDDARGCGALQGANDWTCSGLLRQAASGYAMGPSVFAHELVASGVVASAAHVPQDPADASAIEFAGELTSPASQHYGASLFASGQAPASFSAIDPRGSWQDAEEEFSSCQEYAHDSYYEVTNFWYEVGHARHDPLRTFEIAFGPWLSHGSIGTRHLDGTPFTDVLGNGVLPSSRTVQRNRFFDLPGAHGMTGVVLQYGGPTPAGPNLRQALVAYDPLGAEIAGRIDANAGQVTKDMAFYQAYFENLTVEAVPGLGLSVVPGGGGGSGDPTQSYVAMGDGDGGPSAFQNAVPGDPLIAITGQVPLGFSGGKLMRRMFSAELDELYDLQREKDRLVEEWRSLDRLFAGSGWTIQDLLDELDPGDTLSAGAPAPVPGGGVEEPVGVAGATGYAAADGGGGICCGTMEPAYATIGGGGGGPAGSTILVQQGRVVVDSDLSEESAARKTVLDRLLDVYAEAIELGCLDAGVSYCDFSVKEFALEAIPDAHEEQQRAYEECLAILPPPFASNLGQTRKIIDPVQDLQGFEVPDALLEDFAAFVLEMACWVEVDTVMTASHMRWIAERTAQCRETIPEYETALAALEHEVALHQAKARLANVEDLLDPDTGELVAPGRSASWHELKGSKYFGLEMQYHYAFETDVDAHACNLDLAAGGDFSAAAHVLAAKIPLVDVAAWVRTGPEVIGAGEDMVDVHAEVLGIALFEGQHVQGAEPDDLVLVQFARSDSRKQADVAGLSTNFFLGPIPMSLSVGAGGALGYRFDMAGHFTAFEVAGGDDVACPELAIAGTLEPYVGVYGFIEVAIDIVIARAGVRGEVTLLMLSIPVSVDMTLTASLEPQLGVGMSVAARFESLSGRISAFGEIGPCPFCLRLEKNIVKWDGFRFDQVLFDQQYDLEVADLALVLGN